MSLTRKARNVIKEMFAEVPKKRKADLIEMIRPHYIPDYKKLVEQDLNRIANAIASSIRDEVGARQIFVIESEGAPVFVNVDASEDIQDIRAVYKSLVKARDGREQSIAKVKKRGREVAGQLALVFDEIL